jgi:peptide/nickel transport system substrate-binding protein
LSDLLTFDDVSTTHHISRRELLRRGGALAVAAPPLTSLLRAPAAGNETAVLRVGAIAPPTAVDPVTGFDTTAIALFQQVNEYLLWLEPDLTLSPQLATSWEAHAGGARWVVTVRDGVTFSDGTPLDAATVVSSFRRILDPATGSGALAAFNGIPTPTVSRPTPTR